jgi:M6 family metalloprotease-like protein
MCVAIFATPCLALSGDSTGNGSSPSNGPDLTGYTTPEKAITTSIRSVSPELSGLSGYLGVNPATLNGRLTVADVQPNSPADKVGFKKGDVITHIDGRHVGRIDVFRDHIQSHSPGESIRIGVLRDGRDMELTPTLAAVSRPMKLSRERVAFGAQVANPKDGDEGTPIERIVPDSPAAAAGLKVGDVIMRIDQELLRRASQVTDMLAEHRPGDILKLVVRRDGKEIDASVTLIVDRGGRGGNGFNGGNGFAGGRRGAGGGFSGPPPSTLWTKPVYRLAVVGVEFEDIKHNSKIPLKEWEEAILSHGTYTKKNATGQAVRGSLNDYFLEQSYGAFHIEGKVFDWVAVAKKRGDYLEGSGTSNRGALSAEALAKVTERDGKDALKDFDGVFVIYAGSSAATNRGAVYYPHAGTINHDGKRLPYMLSYEGGERMSALRARCREFAYLLGLPDLAARTENIGSKGVGAWCMLGGPLDEQPQGLCAWAKEQLGWLKPAVIDPTEKQKIVLSPVSSARTQCIKLLARSDGSEYYLLENRTKTGFDSGLPGSGLLIWRVANGRPELIPSHGIEGSAGPRSLPEMIPYPSKANNSFTPFTTPASRSEHGGGLPVYITDIQRVADGRIAFRVGFAFQ